MRDSLPCRCPPVREARIWLLAHLLALLAPMRDRPICQLEGLGARLLRVCEFLANSIVLIMPRRRLRRLRPSESVTGVRSWLSLRTPGRRRRASIN